MLARTAADDNRHCGAHGGAAQIAVLRQRLGSVERQHHLVGEAERQAARGVNFCWQLRVKSKRLTGDQVGGYGDDHLIGRKPALRCLDAHPLPE